MNRFGHAMLEILLSKKVPIAHIYTIHPDDSAKISDYKDFRPIAKKYGIPLAHVKHIRDAKEEIRALKPDYILVFGWSQLLDSDFLTIPTYGVLGSHPALLPKNRGRAAIPWHIINNEKVGGISFFCIDEGCDSGPIIAQKKFAMGTRMTATEYYKRIIALGKSVMILLAPKLIRGEKVAAKAQDERRATYLTKRTFEDGKIDWNKSAVEIERLVRALTEPYPGAWSTLKGKTVIIDNVHVLKEKGKPELPGTVVGKTNRGMVVSTGHGLLEITRIRKGKTSVSPRFGVGIRLG